MSKKRMAKKKGKNREAGFTLIEIVLSMVLVAVVFMAIYSVYAQTIKFDTESRYEIIAAGLAQEGVEMIRNIRDENVLVGNDINIGLSEGKCYPTIGISETVSCNTSGSEKIYLQGSGDGVFYKNSSSGDTLTPFTRECEINYGADGGDKSFTVTCTVKWNSFAKSGLERNVEAKSVLTDWLKE
jgi:prepilin-type N-terminal cleavage/methylation domain-containing protein